MNFVYTLELLGTAAFAVSGALAASRKGMDIFGFCVLALMPAVGGGTIRDIIIDRVPVFWVSDNRYVAVAIIAALVVYFAPHNRPGIRREFSSGRMHWDSRCLRLSAPRSACTTKPAHSSPSCSVSQPPLPAA